jgi:hypothetical protein
MCYTSICIYILIYFSGEQDGARLESEVKYESSPIYSANPAQTEEVKA